MESKTEQHWYLPIMVHESSFELDIPYLFRGDGRPPHDIFVDGFLPRGQNLDLRSHFKPPAGLWSSPDSGYVSTSRSKFVASTFPKHRTSNGFLYVIKPLTHGIDLEKTLKASDAKIHDSGLLKLEQEISIPGGIREQDIKGAWRIEKGMVTDDFIPNPSYQEMTLNRVAKGLKMAGHGATVVAATVDGLGLYRVYDEAKTKGSFDSFFSETTRIIYAWISAYGLGRIASQAASLACAPLGPVASLTCGTVAGLAGSFFGYRAGEKLAKGGLISTASAATEGAPVRKMTSSYLGPDSLVQSLDDYVLSMKESFAEDESVQSLTKDYLEASNKPQAFVTLQQELVSHFSEEEKPVDFKTFALASSQFCYELSQLTDSRVALNSAVTIRSIHDACSGIKTIVDTASSIKSLGALNLTNISGLLNGGSLVLSAFNLFSQFIGDEAEPDHSLSIALSQIQTSIYQMWEDTRRRFEITWKMLEKIQTSIHDMEKRQAKRFLQTLRAIDYYGSQSLKRMDAIEASLHGHLAHTEYTLGSYLHALADERTLDAIMSIHKSKAHALHSFIDYGSTLRRWLTVTAAIPGRSGWLAGKALDAKTLQQRLEEALPLIAGHEPPLGLLATLALKHDASILTSEQASKLIHPKDWTKVLSSYLYLMQLALDAVKDGNYGPVQAYFAEIEAIREIAEIVLEFYPKVRESKLLWEGIVKDYKKSVIDLQAQIKGIIEEERRLMNEAFELKPMDKFLCLDESPQQNCNRITYLDPTLGVRLRRELSPKTLLMSTPIPGEQRIDMTVDYTPWEWEGANLKKAAMIGEPDAYLDERQVDRLLAQDVCRKVLGELISSPEFQLAYLYQQAKLHIQCEAFIPSLHHGHYTISIGLELNHKIHPIYHWTGAAMPGSRGQYVGYGNLLPKMESWAVALFWGNYKGPEYGPTSPWNELYFLDEALNPDFDLNKAVLDMKKLVNIHVLAPRRELVFNKLQSRIKLDAIDNNRLQLFVFLNMFNPGFRPEFKLAAKKTMHDYLYKDNHSFTLYHLGQDYLWRELLAIDLHQSSYPTYGGDHVGDMFEKLILPVLEEFPISDLPLVQEMQRAEFALTRLANELSPSILAAREEFLVQQNLKRLTSYQEKLERMLVQAQVLQTHGHLDTLRAEVQELSLMQWKLLGEAKFSKRSLFPLLLNWQHKPEQRSAIFQAFIEHSKEEDFSRLLEEQEPKTGLLPLHLVASFDAVELVKLCCLHAEKIPPCDYGSALTRGLIACYARWQEQSQTLGFSLLRTMHLLSQAQKKIKAMDTTSRPSLIFLGPTGSGKSSLINACLGVNYKVVEDKYGDLILLAEGQEEPALTSHSSMSATLFPSSYPSLDGCESYVDMPGEDDTRGKPEQICGGVVTQIIYQQCSAIKAVVMVLAKDAFSGRFETVQSLMAKVASIFAKLPEEQMIQHLKLVVTKTQGMDKRQIILKLQKIYDETKTDDGVRRIVANLIRNPGQIILVDVEKPESVHKLKLSFEATPERSGEDFEFAKDSDALVIFKQVLDFMQYEGETLRTNLVMHQQSLAYMLHQKLLEIDKELGLMDKTPEVTQITSMVQILSSQISPFIIADVGVSAVNFEEHYQKTKDLVLFFEIHQKLLSDILQLNEKISLEYDVSFRQEAKI